MSQLPPPNFGNVPGHFNMNGFTAWPMHNQRTTPSIFGRPQVPLLGFPPRLPINAFPYSPVSQFRPGIWPNMNHFAHHAASTPTTGHQRSPSQHQPQVTNFQRKANKAEENDQNSCLKQEFSCDACQKEFSSKETMNAHLGSHVQCNYDGCTFKASRKMLKLHWIQVHASGKMRIKLDTPEEIAKWREERKRKYPTLGNVEKKKEEEAKRKASGQVLKTKNFRYRRGQRGDKTFQRGGHNDHFKRRHPQWQRQDDCNHKGAMSENHSQMNKNTQENGNQEKRSEDSRSAQNGGDPLSFVLGDCDREEGQSDNIECHTKEQVSSSVKEDTGLSNGTPVGTSALTSLCSAYASDSDENEEQTAEINNNNNREAVCDADEGVINKKEIGKGLESMLEIKSKVKQQPQCRPRRLQTRNKKSKSKVNSRSLGIRRSTLLEKLLAPEICHERNIILQCLRHVVKKNFFGVEENLSLP